MNQAIPDGRLGRRVVSVVAVVFAACLFACVASVNVPYQASDADVLDWWQQDDHLAASMVSMGFAAAAAVLFVVVSGHVLLRAGNRCAPLVAFARTMSTAFTVTLLLAGALRGVVGHLVEIEERPLPGLDVLDYATALNYTVLSVVVMTCFALTALAVGALVVRIGILPRWHGVLGLVVGVAVLAAVASSYGLFAVPLVILWSLATAVAVLPAQQGAVPQQLDATGPAVAVRE
jgi:hypothetical protein